MQELASSVLRLDASAFSAIASAGIPPENVYLVSRLILTSVRQLCSRIIPTKFDISGAAIEIMKQLGPFREACVAYYPGLGAEIDDLLMSCLLVKFPNGLADFSRNIDVLMTLRSEVYDAFAFCGLTGNLKNLVVESIRKECLATVESFRKNFEESALGAALDMRSKLLATFEKRFPDINSQKRNLKMAIYEQIVNVRTAEIFDIVTIFPESKPALLDLKESCSMTSSHSKVAETAVKIFVSRLLHIGAATSDIVTQYINAIHALNIVDESGGLTRAISPPIQQYLTTRSDLLDTIVSGILEDDSLAASAVSFQKPNDDDILREAKDQQELDFSWNPEPLHSHIKNVEDLVGEGSDSDALALLLNVYGSIASFVTQLEKEIAKRIETIPGFNYDNEVRAVELLKKRFGSNGFLNCEVILRDAADSRRAANDKYAIIQPLLVSHLYWPEIPDDHLKLPDAVYDEIEDYTDEFEHLKHPRKLHWISSAGCAEIELMFDDGESMEITVTPACACVALLMNDASELTQSMVCETLEMSQQMAENALSFWTQNGVFIRDGDVYHMSPTKPAMTGGVVEEAPKSESEETEEDEEDLAPHVSDARVFGNFVIGILNNRKDEISLTKLYELMKKFIVYPKFDRTYEQYLKIVSVFVEENLITVNDDVVSLVQN